MKVEMSLNPINVNLSWIDYLRGFFAVIVAYIALRCLSVARICKILKVVKHRCYPEIDHQEADIVWAAVRQSSFFFIGRVACLELSLAFMLFALTKGLSATWCVGVAQEPFRAHAWVEIDRQPFREVDYLEQHFRKLLTV
ncbi:MAG: lasso peptide biosynthesis B2 protein [Scytonema sp. RU_4_4]|nr:lasso peptide biosynthesis B2 protein [Scytonema sp. RU_4_4]